MFSLFRRATIALSGKGLRKIPGLASLWTFIYRIISPKSIVLMTCQGSKMYVNPDHKYGGLGVYLLVKEAYEDYETEIFKKLIKPGMVVVDIGANIGYYSLIAAKLVGSSGRVYAFEPVPSNYELLIESIRVNGYSHVTALQKAVSNKNGKIKLFLDKASPVHPSLSEYNVLEEGGSVEVETITMDDFFENFVGENRVDFIKMDTQGAEGLIIEGAERILRNNNLKIVMEFWPHGLSNLGTDPVKLLQKLQNHGFKMKLVDGTDVEITRIIEICKSTRNGNGEVNLLLEK